MSEVKQPEQLPTPGAQISAMQPFIGVDPAEINRLVGEYHHKPMATLHREKEKLSAEIAKARKEYDDNDCDMSKVTSLGEGKPKEKQAKLVQKHNRLSAMVEAMNAKKRIKAETEALLQQAKLLVPDDSPEGRGISGQLIDGLTEQGVADQVLGVDQIPKGRRYDVSLAGDAAEAIIAEVFRTDRTGGAGWEPRAMPRPGLVSHQLDALSIYDIMPVRVTDQSAELFYEEKTSPEGQAAVVEKEEGAAAGSPEFKVELTTVPLSLVPAWIAVTGTQLEDQPQSRGFLDTRLERAVRYQVGKQSVIGDGAAPNLWGMKSKYEIGKDQGTHTYQLTDDAKPLQGVITAVLDPLGGYEDQEASAILMHPGMFAACATQDSGGAQTGFYLGSAQDGFVPRIMGVPVALQRAGLAPKPNAATPGKTGAIVGDFAMYSYHSVRREFTITVGWQNDDIVKDQQTLYGSVRCAMIVTRAAAFQGINWKRA